MSVRVDVVEPDREASERVLGTASERQAATGRMDAEPDGEDFS